MATMRAGTGTFKCSVHLLIALGAVLEVVLIRLVPTLTLWYVQNDPPALWHERCTERGLSLIVALTSIALLQVQSTMQ